MLHHIQTFRSYFREHIYKNLRKLYSEFPGGRKRLCILHTRPDKPRGPPSHIYNGYRGSFPRVMRPRRGVSFPPRLAQVLRLVRTIPLSVICAFVTCCRENLREVTVSCYEIKENINILFGKKIRHFTFKGGGNI
jgi:hypothetical protein